MESKNQKARIKVKSYDHRILDKAIKKIIDTIKSTGAEIKGPIPIPTKRSIYTVIRATHKYKDSREQFEMRTHKRIIDIIKYQPKTLEMLKRINLPSGVDINLKMI